MILFFFPLRLSRHYTFSLSGHLLSSLLVTRDLLLVTSKKLLGTKGLLGAPGLTTRSKEATRRLLASLRTEHSALSLVDIVSRRFDLLNRCIGLENDTLKVPRSVPFTLLLAQRTKSRTDRSKIG